MPMLQVFMSPMDHTIWLVCNFKELHYDWFMSSDIIPKAIVVNHTDGSRQSLVMELVSSLLRLINLEEVARNPSADTCLEQSHDSTEFFDLLFHDCGIKEAQDIEWM
jgi:hypothetical protein